MEGMACTFARSGWRDSMADYIDDHRGLLTRIDLAVDFFDGIKGGIERIPEQYKAGLMDHLGQRPSHKLEGTWNCDDRSPNKGRSYYIGSRQAGKQTNIYEKGVQLFGAKDATNWERIELRLGNKLRVLETEILRRPADFFAGASEWHSRLLREAGAQVTPEPVPTTKRLAAETICAEVKRNVQWLMDTAAPSIALCFEHLGNTDFIEEILFNKKAPGRLQKFSKQEISGAFERAFARVLAPRTGHARTASTLAV